MRSVIAASSSLYISKTTCNDLSEKPEDSELVNIACGATGLELQTEEAEEQDETALCDDAPRFKNSFPGRTTGSIPVFYSSKEDSAYDTIREAFEKGDNRYIRFELPDGGGEEFIASISAHSLSIQVKEALMANVSLKVSGKPNRIKATKEGEA